MLTIQQNIIQQMCQYTSDIGLQQFIKKLYSEVSLDDLSSMGMEHLYNAAVSSFLLLKKQRDKTANINIFRNNKNSDYAVLEVVYTDIPFLVESIGNELKSQEVEIYLIVHPTFLVDRDTKGDFIGINDLSASKEAIMQFHISNWLDDEYYSKLIARINEIISCVNLAVADWQKMRKQMEITIEMTCNNAIISNSKDQSDVGDFFRWLLDGNFIFLGVYSAKAQQDILVPDLDSTLGISKSLLYTPAAVSVDGINLKDNIFISKSDNKSVVHRDAYMNCIFVKRLNQKANIIEVIVFLGFFTKSSHYQSVRNIPYIKNKIDKIIANYGYPEASYNAKELVTVLEGFSRSDLLHMSDEELYRISTAIVSISLIPRVKVFIQLDNSKLFANCIAFIPKAKFSSHTREIIERIFCQQLQCTIIKYFEQITESQLIRLNITVKFLPSAKYDFSVEKIEELIIGAINEWNDDLLEALHLKFSRLEASKKYKKFKGAFDIVYTSNFTAKQAVHDIRMIENALAEGEVKFDFYISAKSDKELIQLKIFSPYEELTLSSVLPIIENIGFFVIDMLTFKVQLKEISLENTIYIHHFRLQCQKDIELKPVVKKNIELALEKIWNNEIENDRFNSLILYANINWREALLLRSFAKYLKQIKFAYDAELIIESLLRNNKITALIIELFNTKFNIKQAATDTTIDQIVQSILTSISIVSSLAEDKILRTFLNLILAIKRTNFFQKNHNDKNKDYISFKVASAELSDVPLPKPFMEIFVYSNRFEAIHLRGGKIARGGIRWSDRKEDYRTEVLGLMKAQMTKNSVIVPVGSKGGFVVKSISPESGRDEFFKEGVECYKIFLRGLLDITDNVVNNVVVHPVDVLCYDENDPYLVVAADKGTATFSDYANSVSKAYNYWLGDAFASGGSAGYDHKKIAITARGAWISVDRHFISLGVDIRETTFTVVAIGDMSGDVFGNGMIISKNIKLIAAFNHMHIFIDPNPDPVKSFEERYRLFNTPKSQWSDYNCDLISKGGGVFSRSTKNITITNEIQIALNITDSYLSPDDLIRAILKAPVDLLWNGGIGTYIKHTNETHEMIGDKANDNLRINGKELRCRVVGEGGNLGFTQLARIEYARNGGKINTDFIDNSAGVDCSDHEVNIKIAFADLLQNKALDLETRDAMLVAMTGEIAELVLNDNYHQTLLITAEENRGKERLDEHAWLIKHLETKGELSRKLEKLPNEEDIAKLAKEKLRLSRPEIAVLIAYAKNSAIKILADDDLTHDRYLITYLINYFPKVMHEKYYNALLNHKLKNEIIKTVLVNDFINILGCCFFHQLLDDGYYKAVDIIKAFIVVRDCLNINNIWQKIEGLFGKVSVNLQFALFKEIREVLQRNIIWLLNSHKNVSDINDMIMLYRPGVNELKQLYQNHLIISARTVYYPSEVEEMAKKQNMSNVLLEEILSIKNLTYAFDIVSISQKAKCRIQNAANTYTWLGDKLSFNWILAYTSENILNNYIDVVALRVMIDEIYSIHMSFAITELRMNGVIENKVFNNELNLSGIQDHGKLIKYQEFIENMKKASSKTMLPMLVVAIKRLKELINI